MLTSRAMSLGDRGLAIEPLETLYSGPFPLLDSDLQDFFKRLPSCTGLPEIGDLVPELAGAIDAAAQARGSAGESEGGAGIPPRTTSIGRALSLEYMREFLRAPSLEGLLPACMAQPPPAPRPPATTVVPAAPVVTLRVTGQRPSDKDGSGAHQTAADLALKDEQGSTSLSDIPTPQHSGAVVPPALGAAQLSVKGGLTLTHSGLQPSLLPSLAPSFGNPGAPAVEVSLVTTPPLQVPAVPPTGDAPPLPATPSAASVGGAAIAAPMHQPATRAAGERSKASAPTSSQRTTVIPNCDGLSKQELRRVRRMISNRESARRCRKRKQEHLWELEEQLRAVQDQLADANMRAARLAEEVAARDAQIMALGQELDGCRRALMVAGR